MKQLFIVLLSILTFSISAQSNLLDIGFEGGLVLSSLRGNEYIRRYQNPKMDYLGGLFVQYNFPKIISVRTGIYHESKGSSSKIPALDINGQLAGTIYGKEIFDYVTIPLLVRAGFGKQLSYFVNGGPYLGILIKQIEHTEAYQTYPEINTVRTDYFKKTEMGLSFGFGLLYTLKHRILFSFEVRDNLGLTNTSKVSVSGNGGIKNNSLNALFGIGYKLGQRK